MEHLELVLAPMEGLTDFDMRQMLTTLSPYSWCVTEFLRVTQQLLPIKTFLRHMPELETASKTLNGTPVHLQLLGSDPIALAENAARAAELGALAIDLNFGCPAKTVNKHRGGAALLQEPELIYRIVTAVRAAVPSHTPVSAKIRLGINDDAELADNVAAIKQAGAAWLTIHARTKAQGYRPPVDWQAIARAKQLAGAMKVIANGDVNSVDAARQCREVTRCNALMIGRAAVSQPGLVAQIARDQPAMCWNDVRAAQLALLQRMVGQESGLLGRYKQWLAMTALHYPEAAIDFTLIKRHKRREEVLELMRSAGYIG
ncbi:MAG: tRNA-dihydrouridine synthase [Paraglaciecola sp.]|nr:tRNA-dihydrouridine synthase [Paraglaciecola sp.]